MGTLYIVSTPIGNLEDITIRAIKTLLAVDIIACEDTRRTGLLLREVKKRFQSVIPAQAGIQSKKDLDPSFRWDDKQSRLMRYDDHQEQSQTPLLIQQLEEGKTVALVSDAGTPLIADPGYTLVHEAIKRGINVVSIPGPSAAIAALSVSGLPTNHFMFLGYPPEKQSHRLKLFQSLKSSWSEAIGSHEMLSSQPLLQHDRYTSTVIFYCAPHKLQQTLGDMQSVFGDIPIVLARELTKIHEEVWHGEITEALLKFSKPVGEFVVLFRIV